MLSLEQMSARNIFNTPFHATRHHVITLIMTDSQTSDLIHIRPRHHLICFIFIFRLFVVVQGGVKILHCSRNPQVPQSRSGFTVIKFGVKLFI